MLVKTESFELAILSKGNPNSKKLALVLPGKLDTKDYSHMINHVNFLAGLGFFALSFDPPGTWESPGDIDLYNVTNYLKAINELISYYGDRPAFVMGHSRGGSMAMLAGTTNPKITAFAAAMSHSYSPNRKSKDDEKFEKEGVLVSFRELPPGTGEKVKEFVLPYSFLEDQRKYDMEPDLRNSKIPKLFIAGKNDITVNPEDVRKVYEMAGEPKEFAELDSDHNYRFHIDLIEEVNKIVGEFLAKYPQI